MARFSALCLLAFALCIGVASASAGKKPCTRSGEVFETCGTACPLKCGEPVPSVCTMQCVEGCQCKPGLLRSANGDCITRKQCLLRGE